MMIERVVQNMEKRAQEIIEELRIFVTILSLLIDSLNFQILKE